MNRLTSMLTHSFLQESAALVGRRSQPATPELTMRFTIDASCVTQLRHLLMGRFGELVTFMRIQPMAHATKMKVCIGLSQPAVDLITAAVTRSVPSAKFSRAAAA
jgi:hypothetical protein